MVFSHILITRPAEDGAELAVMLASHPAQVLVLPAHAFRGREPDAESVRRLADCAASGTRPWVIFTSPRAVEHGLARLQHSALSQCRVAAIGPTTARRLEEAGIIVAVRPGQGHTSEDLLALIPDAPGQVAPEAFIVTAPGGRKALAEGMRQRGYRPNLLMVYQRQPAELDPEVIASLGRAESILSVFTSADTLRGLSQRLPEPVWKRICAGEWIVVSDRLARVAHSCQPERVHLAAGPTNDDLVNSVNALS